MVRPRYQWMYLYGFVEPKSGKTSWLLMPTVNTPVFALALAAFAQEQGAGPNKQILLVLDQAGWHTSCDLVVPEGLHLLFLPSHAPELQPAERLWPLSNEPLANRVFSSRGSSCKTFKQSAAAGFKLILTAFVGGPPFIGGLL